MCELIRGWLVAMASIGGLITGIFGLVKWRKELRGRDYHEAAKGVVRGVYRVREVFLNLRCRFIFAHEADARAAYERRWSRFSDALVELETAMFEAAVLWGAGFEDFMKPVRVTRSELSQRLDRFLQSCDESAPPDNEEIDRASEEFFGWREDGDELGKKLIAALERIEEEARKRLIN